ncbi:hypothetical protein DdX_21762 [Ditylenchus destructor]|uniref:Uncharacterized protein n=1 Tax=Ditylenchus destructor TaxID=166010 RepID=A0AAD4QUZ5_9BILA|nr:hypothetical protein DdX_21762 [Ditylenchus destructor]
MTHIKENEHETATFTCAWRTSKTADGVIFRLPSLQRDNVGTVSEKTADCADKGTVFWCQKTAASIARRNVSLDANLAYEDLYQI